MKKYISVLMALIICLAACPMAYAGNDSNQLIISKDNVSHEISPLLYGVGIEEKSNACDGGLVSNLVNNNSFEYTNKTDFGWTFDNVSAKTENKMPMNSNNKNYQSITVNGKGTVRNLGYTEIYDGSQNNFNKDKAAKADMPFKKDTRYNFGCYLRNVDFEGNISVYLDSQTNAHRVNQLNTSGLGDKKWSYLYTTLTSVATEDGSLAIEFDGTGTIMLDFVTLTSENSHGFENENWKYMTIREDLYKSLENLKPRFIRFYPNSFSNDDNFNSMSNWKNTIGPIESRIQNPSQYADDEKGIYYNSSNFMGMHEYLQLCKDLNAIPIPVLNVGILLSKKSDYNLYIDALNKLNMNEEQWQAYLANERKLKKSQIDDYTQEAISLGINSRDDFDRLIDKIALTPGTDEFNNYAQNVLDLIEYANADSKTSYWGALRGSNGSSEPFNIQYIALGNDNWGDIYLRNFEALYKIIKDKYPNIKIIISANSTNAENQKQNYKLISDKFSDVIIDEHKNFNADNLYKDNMTYDTYDREANDIMLGGYNIVSYGKDTDLSNNNLLSAIEEASYMTALERNSDVVKLSSYSPSLAKINAQDDKANLVWFDSQKTVYTPNYYTQMLFSNNVGTKYVDTQKLSDEIYQSVTVDEDTQTMYIKLVNTGKKRKIKVDLNDFDNINAVSNLSISNKYLSAYNKSSVNYILPNEAKMIEHSDNSFDVTLNKNSVNIIRLAYSENTGANFYELPDEFDNYDVSHYVPQDLKVGFVSVVVVSIILAIAISIFMKKYNRYKARNK